MLLLGWDIYRDVQILEEVASVQFSLTNSKNMVTKSVDQGNCKKTVYSNQEIAFLVDLFSWIDLALMGVCI